MPKNNSHPKHMIAILGPHGRSELVAAILKSVRQIGSSKISATEFLSQKPQYLPINEKISVAHRHAEFETSGKHYTLIDCNSHNDIVKMLIGRSPRIESAILVISAEHGITDEIRQQIEIANLTDVKMVLPFLDLSDQDDELIEICEMEITELFDQLEIETAPIIRGDLASMIIEPSMNSKIWRSIINLILQITEKTPATTAISELPLIMPIQKVEDKSKGISILHGQIAQGEMHVGQQIDVVGMGDRIRTRCIAQTENTISVDSDPDWIKKGMIVSDPKRIRSHQKFSALIYLITIDESGINLPIANGDKIEVRIWTIDVSAQITLPEDLAIVSPSENAIVSISLDQPIAIEKFVRFEIKKMDVLIGSGIVTEIV